MITIVDSSVQTPEKSYIDSFAAEGNTNVGIVLKPDSGNKVKWSMLYSWAKEEKPVFRYPHWKESLHPVTELFPFPASGIVIYKTNNDSGNSCASNL